MKTVILACNTVRDEIQKAASETLCPHPFVWVESGLHLVPEKLRGRLQEELDRIHGVSRVLLAFGFCGNAVAGLRAGAYEIVFPRVDDCITLLLGSKERRDECSRQGGVYFLTKGWLEGEVNIWSEYQSVLARFGLERTERIYQRMLAHYHALGLIDTGAYDVASLLPQVQEIARRLKLEARVLPGSIAYLKNFLSGPWSEKDYVIVPPFSAVEPSYMGLDCSPPGSRLPGAL